jgi:hypothetical protein
MGLKMNRKQQRARVRLLEMKRASELPIIEVSSLPTTGSFDVIYLYNDGLYTWNGSGYDDLIPTDINKLSDEDDLLSKAVSVTYAELQALVTASSLEVGQKYLISDFAQSYNIFDGSTMTIIEEQTGVLEPIIVTAASTNSIYKEAISTLYPKDTIHYSLDLVDDRDIGFGDGAGTPLSNFKGQIYYREDTVQNVSTHYDFRNVKFRRWAVDAVEWTDIGFTDKDVIKSAIDDKIYKCILTHTATGIDPSSDAVNWILWLDITSDAFVSWSSIKNYFNLGGITTDNLIINNVTAGVDYDDFYTFGDYYNWVKDVEIGGINLELMIGEIGFSSILFSQKVFKTTDNPYTCFSIKFGDNNLPMTFGDNNELLTFGNNNRSMTFGNSTNPQNRMITFGDGTTICIFEDRCFTGLAADLDLSAATHIRGAYNTTIYQDAVDGVKLSYMTGGVLTIADVTDII